MLSTIVTSLFLFLIPTTAQPPAGCPVPSQTSPNATRTPPRRLACQTAYPASIQILNSLYPANESAPTRFFQVIHQINDTSGFHLQVASQVQFLNIPAAPPIPCTLELQLPSRPDWTNIKGPTPMFKVYNVARDPGAPATWDTFEGRTGTASVVGVVDGRVEALASARGDRNGVVEVCKMDCNETMTFQMAMVEPEKAPWFNYWDFLNVAPPADPVQGWRIVHSC